jgi:microcystin-dependent protein
MTDELTTLPVGYIMEVSTAIHSIKGWIVNPTGQTLSKAEYPELAAVLGTAYGTPEDDSLFAIPDLHKEDPEYSQYAIKVKP